MLPPSLSEKLSMPISLFSCKEYFYSIYTPDKRPVIQGTPYHNPFSTFVHILSIVRMERVFRDQTSKEEYEGWRASCNLLYDIRYSMRCRYDRVGVHMLPIPGQTTDWVWNNQREMFHLVVGTEADDTEKGVVVPIDVTSDDKHFLFNEGELNMFDGDIDRYGYILLLIVDYEQIHKTRVNTLLIPQMELYSFMTRRTTTLIR